MLLKESDYESGSDQDEIVEIDGDDNEQNED